MFSSNVQRAPPSRRRRTAAHYHIACVRVLICVRVVCVYDFRPAGRHSAMFQASANARKRKSIHLLCFNEYKCFPICLRRRDADACVFGWWPMRAAWCTHTHTHTSALMMPNPLTDATDVWGGMGIGHMGPIVVNIKGELDAAVCVLY